MKVDPTDWLPERENPSVRHFALRDILDCSDKDPEIVEARAAIRRYKKVSKIFRKQKPGGYWESAEHPYHPKYKSNILADHNSGSLGARQGRRAS